MNDYPILSTSDIIIPERLRKDHGDIEDFAAGIAELGHLIEPIVLNRKQLILPGEPGIPALVSTDQWTYILVAGGRRTKALTLLGWPLRHGVEYVFKTELSDDKALEMELAENVERLDMTWQERAASIWRIHSLKVKLAAEDCEDWGHEATGRLLKTNRSDVQINIQVAKALVDTSTPEAVERAAWINGAEHMREAVTRLMKSREDEGMRRLAQSLIVPNVPAEYQASTEPGLADDLYELPAVEGQTIVPVIPITTIEITKMLHLCNCLDFLKALPDASLDAHVLTDPPYGIDMSNLQQQGQGMNVENVAAEHHVEDNLSLLRALIPELYRVLVPERFVVLFCDMEHFDKLIDLGFESGFKVQRWPLVWVKTHHCMNNASQFNFTKATEDAIIFRKGSAIMTRPPQQNWFMGDNVAVKERHGGHPFVKPDALWQWIADHIALKGQTIFDPFMGEGSCGEAVLATGYKYLGCESNETHYSKAVVYLCEHFSKIYNNKVRFV